MKRMISYALMGLMALTCFYSCKKDDDTKAKDNTELILGTWAYTDIRSDKPFRWEDSVIGTNGFTYRKDCVTGSTITFNKGANANTGPFLMYDNCEKFNDDDTWILQGGVLTVGGDDFAIEQLDSKVLKMSYMNYYNNQDVKVTLSFQHQ